MDWLLVFLLLTAIVVQGYIALKLRGRFSHLDSRLDRMDAGIKAKIEKVAGQMQSNSLDINNAISLHNLGFKYPVFFGDWSIDGFMGRFLVQHLLDKRPKTIVELGSGSSTILIARCLQLMQETDVNHIAVDHENKYLDLTRKNAQLNGVESSVTFLECPLSRYESINMLWYSDLAEKLAGKQIDLLIVDAPPGSVQPHSRYPALPLLAHLLAEHCTVVLDDASRKEEQEIAQRWVKEFPDFILDLRSEGHGLAVLSR